jgi:hypothetical protein
MSSAIGAPRLAGEPKSKFMISQFAGKPPPERMLAPVLVERKYLVEGPHLSCDLDEGD